MFSSLKKMMYLSVGVAVKTKEALYKSPAVMKEKLTESEKIGAEKVESFKKKCTDTKAAGEFIFRKRVESVLQFLDIPTRTEMNNLKREVSYLYSIVERKPDQE